MKTLRAAIYTRVSKASRDANTKAYDQNPKVQEAPLRQLARQRGWKVTAVYSDRISGAKDTRPGLAELMTAARRGEFDVLLVWRFDRLSRSAAHFLATVQELERIGVDLVSHQEQLDTTTPMGRCVRTILAAIAELEREVIRDRIFAGLEHARTNGTKSGKSIGRPRRVFDRVKARELRDAGMPLKHIAALLGVGETTVRRVCQ
jgi:DNA invertase Pin-like site-specific DNA recombinase